VTCHGDPVPHDRDYPAMSDHREGFEPSPRRVRGYLAGRLVFDTVDATYVWESPRYPQYYVPVADIDLAVLVDEGHTQRLRRGTADRHGLRVGDVTRPGALRIYHEDAADGIAGRARFEWDALDEWFEEDEQIFVHPRNPYTRVDAVRSTRHVKIELGGAVLAESTSTVMIFETGLPTRYYFDRAGIDFRHLRPTDTQSACPYKGNTSGYWSADIAGTTVEDVAWTYQFPTKDLLPIAGLVASLNERVDVSVDGRALPRPTTPFS